MTSDSATPAPPMFDLDALETIFDLIAPQGDLLMDTFYRRLFEAAPSVRPLFPTDMRAQKAMLLGALVLLRRVTADLGAIVPKLRDLGARHVAHGAVPGAVPRRRQRADRRDGRGSGQRLAIDVCGGVGARLRNRGGRRVWEPSEREPLPPRRPEGATPARSSRPLSAAATGGGSAQPIASEHHASTSSKRRSATTPNSSSRVSFSRVVAGLVIPQRNRARWRAAPRAAGLALTSAASALSSTSADTAGRASASGRLCAAPVRQKVQWPHGSAAHFAEVADQRVDLAALMDDERDDAPDPLHLRLLPPIEALDQARQQLVPRLGRPDHGEALAHITRAQLDELLLEVAERGNDSAPLLVERDRQLLGIEVGPRRPVLPLATSRRRKSARTGSNVA